MIGFIGTVEGISKALMNISLVLPMVKNLDGFMNNLTSVTSALQVAFDSTLLALFLSAALMLVQTLVYKRSEDLLGRVDRWVVEMVLAQGRGSTPGAPAGGGRGRGPCAAPRGDAARPDARARAGHPGACRSWLEPGWARGSARTSSGSPTSVDSCPQGPLAGLHEGAQAIGRAGNDLARLGTLDDGVRKGVGILGRIEVAMTNVEPTLAAARGDQAEALDRTPPGRSRGTLAVVGLVVRALQPGQPGATRQDPPQPQGRARPAQRQHGAGQRPVSGASSRRTFSTYPVVSQDSDAA